VPAIRKSRRRSTEVHSRRVQSEYAASQATKAGYQARIAQTFLDSRNEIATELTNPGLDILSFELGGGINRIPLGPIRKNGHSD
jgi:hypothetical protein